MFSFYFYFLPRGGRAAPRDSESHHFLEISRKSQAKSHSRRAVKLFYSPGRVLAQTPAALNAGGPGGGAVNQEYRLYKKMLLRCRSVFP